MDHGFYMQRCFQLAEKGTAYARPNPLVGSVIVHEGRIIGEGYHAVYGGPHAEVNAVNSVQNPDLLKESTLYVNLEPCAHFGKTPPCANLIIEKQIPRVVVSCTDTFSAVAGKGIQRLKDAGVQVTTGILEEEGRRLNKRFFTFHEKQRPYILLKWAQSEDGFLDLPRTAGEKGIRWITGPETRQLVHLWRSEEAAIAVGHNTWINDQPGLNVREMSGRSPVRIILSRAANLSGLETGDLVVKPSVDELIAVCREQNLSSVLIEGGSATLAAFIERGLWDEIRVLTGRKIFGHGLKAPLVSEFHSVRVSLLPGGDQLTTYVNTING